MNDKTLHPGLEMRLSDLASRIANLKRVRDRATGLEKIKSVGQIEFLEKRHQELEEQLRKLNSEGPGFRQNVKAEIEKFADDVSGTIEDLIMHLDATHHQD